MVKAGAPTKYKKEYCQKVIDFMAQGYSFEAFAGSIGVCADTVFEWAKVHPEFSDSKKLAYERNRVFWETQGIDGLRSSKNNSFNATVWIFNMKNRFRWRDRVEHSGGIEIDGTRKKLEKLLLNPDLSSAARKLCLELSEDVDEDGT
jgi:hypothetical protein